MGSVMHFQRTLNLLSRGSAPGYLAVFILSLIHISEPTRP